jgi:hypothetical protein
VHIAVAKMAIGTHYLFPDLRAEMSILSWLRTARSLHTVAMAPKPVLGLMVYTTPAITGDAAKTFFRKRH